MPNQNNKERVGKGPRPTEKQKDFNKKIPTDKEFVKLINQ